MCSRTAGIMSAVTAARATTRTIRLPTGSRPPHKNARPNDPPRRTIAARPKKPRPTAAATRRALRRICASYAANDELSCAHAAASPSFSSRLSDSEEALATTSPRTSSSSVQPNRSHIRSSLSISGYARSASHLLTAWRDTPSIRANCSCVRPSRARRRCKLSRKLMTRSLRTSL